MNSQNDRPQIYDYVDYVKFLNDMVEWMRSQSKVFSLRYFAKKAGFASSSTLQFVLSNKRGLTLSSANKVCKGLVLDTMETKYFINLIQLNQASTAEEKNVHFQDMLKIQKRKNIRVISADQYEYFSKWYHPAIRELVRCKDFQGDPKWIVRKISPMISVIEARESLKLLLRLGLIEKVSETNYKLTDRAVATDKELLSMVARNFHREMCDRAKETLDTVDLDHRDFSGVTFGIPASKFGEIREKIREFRKQLTSSVGSLDEDTEDVYHMNIQLFPLTKKRKS
jgi:uncharacterized protein (TIGR02147 family)